MNTKRSRELRYAVKDGLLVGDDGIPRGNATLYEECFFAEIERLQAVVDAGLGWRENDWPAWFCYRTAEALADRMREARAAIAEPDGEGG